MAVIGVAVYGSRARDDADAHADIDLLAVTTDPKATTVARGNVNFSSYPLRQIICRACVGDLFVLHIASEARVLYEAWPVFEQIRRSFKYKGDYAREIGLASDVGWFLVRYPYRFTDAKRFNERMAWCIRTMLIAHAANEQRAIFSARGLAEFANSADVLAIIRNKDNPQAAAEMVERFAGLLARFGAEAPRPLATLHEEQARFDADRNTLGVRSVRAVMATASTASRSPAGV
jgi:hypothetical protein